MVEYRLVAIFEHPLAERHCAPALAGGSMLQGKCILIVEDDPILAMDLVDQVEQCEGIVIGPVPTVHDALEILDHAALGTSQPAIAAAILDVQLRDRDVTPVALRLSEAGVPFVVHTGTGPPPVLTERLPDLPVVMKPAPASEVVERLLREIARTGPRPDPGIAPSPAPRPCG